MSIAQDLDALKSFGQVAAPAGLAIGAFLYIARDLIAKNIFPTLTRERAYHVVITLVFVAWTVAIAGIGSWTYVATHASDKGKKTRATELETTKTVLNDLLARNFDAVYASFSDRVKAELPPHKISAAWDGIVDRLGPPTTRISEPLASTYQGRPAYVATYQGTKGVASIFIVFDVHGDVDVLWWDWSP
jgi:hypothetical protein